MKRMFIAVELPQEVRKKLIELQKNLNLPEAKLVKPEAMHLTLVFLGNVDEEKMKIASQELKKDLASFGTFSVSIKGLGAFPKLSKAHIVWVGLDGVKKLKELEDKIRHRLKSMNFRLEDRPFMPHLTIARLRQKTDLANLIKKIKDLELAEFGVKDIIIFESKLTPLDPIHKAIGKIKLGEK